MSRNMGTAKKNNRRKIMKELLEYLAKSLVDNPDEVQVKLLEAEKTVVLELRVSPEDMGKIIGKQGRIAQAIRTVIRAAAVKEGKRVVVEII
jgi:hypothetical protein